MPRGIVAEARPLAFTLRDGKVFEVNAKTSYVRQTPIGEKKAQLKDLVDGAEIHMEVGKEGEAVKITITKPQ
jgi:hypothetical protein